MITAPLGTMSETAVTKKKSESSATKKKSETSATKKNAGDKKPEPTHPKYDVMIAEIVKNCENTRAGISRAGILKALLELPYNLGGPEDEKKTRVNVLMKRSLKKSVEAGSLKMAAVEGRKGSGHFKLTDNKIKKTKTAGVDGEVKVKIVKKAKKSTPVADAAAEKAKEKDKVKKAPAADVGKAKPKKTVEAATKEEAAVKKVGTAKKTETVKTAAKPSKNTSKAKKHAVKKDKTPKK